MKATKSTTKSSASRAKRGSTRRPALPALKLRTILVPVDFSKHSLNALDFAVSLARRFSASIALLHVLDPIYSREEFDTPRLRPLRAHALADAHKRLATLAKTHVQPHVSVVHHVRQGVAYSVIVEAASKAQVGLIVMGTRGRTGVRRLFIGSVAERVVRLAPCPVLVVR